MSQEQVSQNYNDPAARSQMFGKNAVGLSESEDSMYARRRDSTIKDVHFIQTSNYSYEVVQAQYLVPKDGLVLNPMNFDTFQSVFDAEGFKPGDRLGDDLKLVTPAKVSLDESGNYQLVEKGKFVSLDLYQQQAPASSVVQQQLEPDRPFQSELSPLPALELNSEPITSSIRSESEAIVQPEAEPITIEVNSGRVQEIPSERNGYDRSGLETPPLNEANSASQTPPSQEPNVERLESKPVESTNKVNEGRDSEPAPVTFDDLKKSGLSQENMDYALSIEQQLSQRNIDTQRLEIFFNGESQFKIKDYGVTNNKLGNEAVALVKTALNDPANLKGEVLIKQGSKVLLHVKDGQVLRDPLRMVNESVKVEANTTTQALYQNVSAGVSSKGLQQIQDVSKNAYQTGAQVEQVLDMNRQYNPEYKKQVNKIGADAVDSVVKQAHTKVALEQQSQQQSTSQSKTQQKTR